MSMTVGELIEMLQEFNPDSPVTIMYQPGYPLEANVNGVTSTLKIKENELHEEFDDDLGFPSESEIESELDAIEEKVIITTAWGDIGYGNRRAWD